jgi:hypothetical protein
VDLNKALLEKLVVDHEDFEHLESLLDQFNVFEAVDMVRQEICHSSFLASLLNPSAFGSPQTRVGEVMRLSLVQRSNVNPDR